LHRRGSAHGALSQSVYIPGINVYRRLEFDYLRYAYPMTICDVVGCSNFAVTHVSAPGVEGGHLNICDEHLADIESGVRYSVDTHARKLLLSEKPSE
jgi:hypothetical protein